MSSHLYHAREAVNIGIEVFKDFMRKNKRIHIEKKGPKDYVTQLDFAIEEAIFAYLDESFKGRHKLFGEETVGKDIDIDLETSQPQWILDPLDGTVNFCHGFPHYAIALSVVYDGHVQVAITHDLSRDLTFSAERGRGARMGNRRLRCSLVNDLNDTLLSTSSHGSLLGDYNFSQIETYRSLYQNDVTIRQTGSVVLDLAYVAAGMLDGFWGNGLRPWDIAAGSLLVTEAGGRISDFRGHPNILKGDHVIASASKMYRHFYKAIGTNFQLLEK